MNDEQVKAAIRWAVSTFGGMIAGWAAAKGWFTVDQVLSVLNSETWIGIVTSLVMLGWGMLRHTETGQVAAVAKLAASPTSPVKAVIVDPSAAGIIMEKTIGSGAVAMSGTAKAEAVAR